MLLEHRADEASRVVRKTYERARPPAAPGAPPATPAPPAAALSPDLVDQIADGALLIARQVSRDVSRETVKRERYRARHELEKLLAVERRQIAELREAVDVLRGQVAALLAIDGRDAASTVVDLPRAGWQRKA